MKVASKHWSVALAVVVACSSGSRADDVVVDVWTSRGGDTAHVRSPAANAVCSRRGADRAGWELRLDGAEGDPIRRVDIEIPRAESAGTPAFYAGVTTIRRGKLDQWRIETRAPAARPTGEGRAWTEATSVGVTTTIVARIDSSWYSIRVHCGRIT